MMNFMENKNIFRTIKILKGSDEFVMSYFNDIIDIFTWEISHVGDMMNVGADVYYHLNFRTIIFS